MRAIFAVLVATCSLVCNLVAANSAMNFTNIFPNITRCTRNQQHLNECIERSIRAMRRYLIRGVPRLNIPSYDPFFIDKRTMRMKGGVFSGTATFMNMWIDGLTDYDIYQVEYIGPTLQMRLDVFFPIIQFDADYEIDGTLMFVPLKRRGNEMSITCIDVRAFILLNGTDYKTRNGLHYFKVEKPSVDVQVRIGRIHFEDLRDDYYRNLKLNEYLNKRFEIHYPEIMIKVGYFASEIIETIVNKIYWLFPISTMLLNP